MIGNDLAAWLLEQIAEDERAVRALLEQSVLDEFLVVHHPIQHAIREDPDPSGAVRFRLSECDVKRRIVAEHTCPCPDETCRDCGACSGDHHADPAPAPCPTLRLLTLPYIDRVGYQEAWRP